MSIFSSLVPLLPLPLLLLTSFITPSASASEAAFIYDSCSQAKFTPGSAYESGIKSVLTSIVNAAMFSSYNNFTVLASSSSSSSSQDIPIYGLFQCRGDLAATDCSHCVVQAVSQLGTICLDSIAGSLQLNGCFVAYDDSKFLGGEDNTLVLRKCGPPDGFNSDMLTQRDAVLAYLETSDGVYNMFRTTSSGNLQGMTQCVGDLSANECQDCLSSAIGRLRVECGPVQWGQIYLAKCYVRYSEGGDQSPAGNSKGGDQSPNGNGEPKNKNKKNILNNLLKIFGVTAGGLVTLLAGGKGIRVSFKTVNNYKEKQKEKKAEKAAAKAKKDEAAAKATKDEAAAKAKETGTKETLAVTPTSRGFQVIVPGPIFVAGGTGPPALPPPPPTIVPVDCTCNTGHCTCNNGYLPPWNYGRLSICNY